MLKPHLLPIFIESDFAPSNSYSDDVICKKHPLEISFNNLGSEEKVGRTYNPLSSPGRSRIINWATS